MREQLDVALALPLQPRLRGAECACGVGTTGSPCLFTLGRRVIENVVVISGLVYFMAICYFMTVSILVTEILGVSLI